MTTFPSKEAKKQSLDLILVLALIALTSVAMAFGFLNTNYGFVGMPPSTQGGTISSVSLNIGNSVSADQQYWSAKCSHGWTSDSTCDALASLTQSCVVGIGVPSAYCSEYDSYVQQIRTQ
jgi:hypothetical protein